MGPWTKTKAVKKYTLKNNQTRKVEAEKGTKKKSSGGRGVKINLLQRIFEPGEECRYVFCEQEDTIMKEGAQVMPRLEDTKVWGRVMA